MQVGQPSRTAQYNALFRAIENLATTPVLRDPVAAKLLNFPLGWLARAATHPWLRFGIKWYIDYRWPGVRASVIARSAIIDRQCVSALRNGVTQLVILGAGLDTRVHRIGPFADVIAFEVDHPDTQRSKLARLKSARPSTGCTVRYVPVDFNHSAPDLGLQASGFDNFAQCVIVCEGISNYLDASAVESILRWCSERPAGSELLFTYVHRDVLNAPENYLGTAQLNRSLARVGERLTFGSTPEEMRIFVESLGMTIVSDRSAADFRADAYGIAASHIRGHEFYHLTHVLVNQVPANAA
jgi:methyltransferase (TIGR00027 family)